MVYKLGVERLKSNY